MIILFSAKLVKDNVVDFVTCLICLEIADDAMETSCCHKIYCRDCLSKVESRLCPTCRQEFKMIISHTTRRIIGSLPASCPNAGCSLESTVSEIKVHERKCEFLKRACLIPDCQVCATSSLGLGWLSSLAYSFSSPLGFLCLPFCALITFISFYSCHCSSLCFSHSN